MFPSQKSLRRNVDGKPDGASMGPGCFHPRNEAVEMRSAPTYPASMGPGCFHPRNVAMLFREEVYSPASMGPGCFHPRNSASAVDKVAASLLQWGRDVSIPEITLQRRRWHQPGGFNGAGMFPSQKY